MTFYPIKLEDTHVFNSLFLDFVHQKNLLSPLHNQKFSINKEITVRNDFTYEKRIILSNLLNEQYATLEHFHESVKNNIQLLKNENTYTITCGHQLNLFTGSYFFVFKVLTTIRLARILNNTFKDKQFVPVLWLANEDHDFDEINHFELFGKLYVWNFDSQQTIAGEIATTDIKPFLDQLPKELEPYKRHYTKYHNLTLSTFSLLNDLFGENGLIIVDATHTLLKKQFIPIMHADLEHEIHYRLIQETNEFLIKHHYKCQLSPRPINLFYIEPNTKKRLRITHENGKYRALNSNITWSKASIKDEITNFPERFSPNAALRPLYQETILPNVVFVGGPAELCYWLQLKSIFDYHNIPYPLLKFRLSGSIVNQNYLKKWLSYGLKFEDFFLEEPILTKKIIQHEHKLDFSYENELQETLFTSYLEKLKKIDHGLVSLTAHEFSSIKKMFSTIEKKAFKTAERKNIEKNNQLKKIQSKVIENKVLAERRIGFFSFYLNHPSLLSDLLTNFPLEDLFYIIEI